MNKKETAIKLLASLRDASHQAKYSHITGDDAKSFADYRMLSMIFNHFKNTGEGIKASDIAEILKVALPTVSQKISEFEQDGYIQRKQNQNDRRVSFLYLTPKGEDIVKENFQTLSLKFEKTVELMGQDKAEILCELLCEFKESLSKTNNKKE